MSNWKCAGCDGPTSRPEPHPVRFFPQSRRNGKRNGDRPPRCILCQFLWRLDDNKPPVASLFRTSHNTAMPVSIENVTLDHYEPGHVVGSPTPRLSRQFAGDSKNWRHRSYDFRVNRSGRLNAFHVDSAESVLVPWRGEPLKSRESVEVEVIVTGENGKVTPTLMCLVEAALLSRDDWSARLITGPAEGDGPALRTSFASTLQSHPPVWLGYVSTRRASTKLRSTATELATTSWRLDGSRTSIGCHTRLLTCHISSTRATTRSLRQWGKAGSAGGLDGKVVAEGSSDRGPDFWRSSR
jgi:hypothetical protein